MFITFKIFSHNTDFLIFSLLPLCFFFNNAPCVYLSSSRLLLHWKKKIIYFYSNVGVEEYESFLWGVHIAAEKRSLGKEKDRRRDKNPRTRPTCITVNQRA